VALGTNRHGAAFAALGTNRHCAAFAAIGRRRHAAIGPGEGSHGTAYSREVGEKFADVFVAVGEKFAVILFAAVVLE
jgi:hypothetical protein